MSQQLVVGNVSKGLTTNPLAFNIDNDAFPYLLNAYQWRGRIKRKRGTSLLTRLERYFDCTQSSYTSTATLTLSSGAQNLITGFGLNTSAPNASLVPGGITVIDTTASKTYTDNSLGVLSESGGNTGTVNYTTGAITISGGASDVITAKFFYYPGLPVMGLESLNLNANEFPGTLAFDTVYSYNILTADPNSAYDVSFYKNPASATYSGYTAKTAETATTWNGQDYQQFFTVNYQGALWATNGINVPFSVTNIGMQFKPIISTTVTSGGPPAVVSLNIIAHGLVVGDFLFINEVATTTGINFQTGYVTAVTDANNVVVKFPEATIASNGTGGIAQYLTNRSDPTKDCLRFYDGDPTNGSPTAPALTGHNGWVNFAPPLSQSTYSIGDLPSQQYYLVGARLIAVFKDRLLFFGPVIQTSSAGSQIYLQDTVIYSQNGTPYYTASFTPTNSGTYPQGPYGTNFQTILTPTNQSSGPGAWFEDQTGLGGFITAGVAQPILTVAPNEDVLIVGFTNHQTRFVYSGNDLLPFNFFTINAEYGSGSTFSAVTFDRGIVSIGNRGIIQTAQVSSERIDLQIPDTVFDFALTNNGPERISSARDFINEWIYFTYPTGSNDNDQLNTNFPNQTLQYNYRDQTWAIFNESYTTYGLFYQQSGYIWSTIGTKYATWDEWTDPWNAGVSTLEQPKVIAGNQQGFVMLRAQGTGEGTSLLISGISGNTITSPDHNLNNGDFISISDAIGSTGLNGIVWQVSGVTANTFIIASSPSSTPGGIYIGGGLITRMYIPLIMTKQFPIAWSMGRKTRIGAQQYLLTTTGNGQITLQIYLSMNDASPYNFGPIVPAVNSINDALIYSQILYTCPESTNLGLTPANINLQMVTGAQQNQIWHRVNTSLIGDTVQLGFTLSQDQMFDSNQLLQFAEIELHGFILNVSPSQILA